jgi:hypothetical protein
MSKQLFLPKMFTTNTLCVKVYLMYECDKNTMPYCNEKSLKKSNFWEFWPLMEHGPCWINFTIFTFISEKIDTLKNYIKFGTKLFHLTWEKKVKCETNHGKSEEKGEFGNLWSESLRFKCGTTIMLIPYSHLFDSLFNASFLKIFCG